MSRVADQGDPGKMMIQADWTLLKQLPKRSKHFLLIVCTAVALAGMANAQVVFESEELSEEEVEEVRRYTVEMIVFEYAESAVSGNEIFEPDEILPEDELYSLQPRSFGDPGSVVDLEAPVAIDDAELLADESLEFLLPEEPEAEQVLEEFPSHILQTRLEVLDPDRYAMVDIYKKLVELDAYKPIMRAAWTQATYEEEDTLPIRLRRLGDAPLRLDGNVTLYLSRYLHLVVDLTIESEHEQSATRNVDLPSYYGDRRASRNYGYGYEQEQKPIKYSISENAIFRNGELRYYDHPRFGVLARITRYEEPGPETDEMFLMPADSDVSN